MVNILYIPYLQAIVILIYYKRSQSMSLTDAELQKYRAYLEEGTMDGAAKKLGITPGAISEAVRNVEKKITDSITNLKLGIELELPFKRIKQEELMNKLTIAFDKEKEIIVIDKTLIEDFKKILKQEGLPDWQELVRQIIYEKWRGYKKKYPLIFKSE